MHTGIDADGVHHMMTLSRPPNVHACMHACFETCSCNMHRTLCEVVMEQVPHRGGCDCGKCDEYTTQRVVRAATRSALPHLATPKPPPSKTSELLREKNSLRSEKSIFQRLKNHKNTIVLNLLKYNIFCLKTELPRSSTRFKLVSRGVTS